MRRFAVVLVGGVEGGEFALCVGEWCTGPIPWDATAEDVAAAVRGLGVETLSFSGGRLPDKEVVIGLPAGLELTADENHSLTANAYFGGAGCAVVVGEVQEDASL
jgi:hypothetical protein